MPGLDIRWEDQIVVGAGLVLLIVIGVICSRGSKTDEGYFLAGRSMPSWVVGFSLMATIISSMTFLALPAFAYGEANWRNFVSNFTYIPVIFITIYLFIPFYRAMQVRSAYEYLERRFGLWARIYAAAVFVVFHFFRTGVVLYAVSLAISSILQTEKSTLPLIILLSGVLVSVYTIVGGLRAVIWTDVFQGIALILGGLICLPVIVSQLDGGIAELFRVAREDDKFDLGSTELTMSGKTMWTYVASQFIVLLHLMGTDQTNVQRYCAAKSDKAASRAAVIGCALAVPIWSYFLFLGTCLYVFVKQVPNTGLEGLDADLVFPRFILTQVPAGLGGFVLTGLMASAMSTLDSSINATAATLTNDFYRRLWVKDKDPRHYGNVGKLISLLFSMGMISAACGIHYFRASEETLDDLQRTLLSILGGGLLSLFLLGFLTLRVDSRSAIIATVTTVVSTAAWLLMYTPQAEKLFPHLTAAMPDGLWIGVLANMLLFAIGYGISWLIGTRHNKDLTGLTVWRNSGKPDTKT